LLGVARNNVFYDYDKVLYVVSKYFVPNYATRGSTLFLNIRGLILHFFDFQYPSAVFYEFENARVKKLYLTSLFFLLLRNKGFYRFLSFLAFCDFPNREKINMIN